ncbi:MAG: 2-oxoacid:acceptor oxidoreductase family protein, partial [Dehalococcoidales bacterium]|nr:2-oxoacid:acceptor oxidoreductase family protein [Dehalococcoidales bacterium]
MPIDLNVMVGGEAGQGIQTIGFVLGKVMSRGGYHVFADQDYESRIRGGHNFFRIRIKDEEVNSHDEKLDILIALNKETVDLHRSELKENGIIIADGQALKMDAQSPPFLDVPLEKTAVEVASNKIMSNSVAVGAVLGLTGYDFDILADVMRWNFAKYPEKIQEDNIRAARAGYDYSARRIPPTFKTHLQKNGDEKCVFLNGN